MKNKITEIVNKIKLDFKNYQIRACKHSKETIFENANNIHDMQELFESLIDFFEFIGEMNEETKYIKTIKKAFGFQYKGNSLLYVLDDIVRDMRTSEKVNIWNDKTLIKIIKNLECEEV